LGFRFQNCPVSGQAFYSKFLQAAVTDPILGIDFLRKFRITVVPETSQVLFACTATAPAAAEPVLPNISPIVKPTVPIPSATQKILDSVPDDMKHLLLKIPLHFAQG
jgi:hypothetical protein